MNQQKKRVKLAAGKAGRPKKLTPEQLRRGVEAYFASISYLEPVEIEEPVILETDPETGAITYQRDSYGHIMFRRRPVTDAGGKQLMRLKYIEPPGDFGICNFLKISRDTWERYGSAVERLEERRASASNTGTPPHPSPGFRETPGATFPSRGRLETGDAGDGGRSEAGGTPPPLRRSPSPASRGGLDGGCSEAGDAHHPSAAPTPSPEGVGLDTEMEEAREYAAIYALARGRVCAYLERASEEKGASKGAVFKLERIYGLGEKKEVTVSAGGGVEEFLRNIGGEAEY